METCIVRFILYVAEQVSFKQNKKSKVKEKQYSKM